MPSPKSDERDFADAVAAPCSGGRPVVQRSARSVVQAVIRRLQKAAVTDGTVHWVTMKCHVAQPRPVHPGDVADVLDHSRSTTAADRLFRGNRSSFMPARIVGRDMPVARDTRDTPPHPRSRASAAAHCRRRRSSNSMATAMNFRRIRASTCASCMRKSSHKPLESPMSTCKSYFFALP